jgi:uncharacterized protein (DUF58 family)
MISRRGIGVGIGAFAVYVVGAVFHYPEFGVLAGAGAGALLVGLVWVLWRPPLSVDRLIEPTRVTKGEVALGRLSVRNAGRLSAPATVAIEALGTERLVIDIPRLSVGGRTRTTYRLPTDRRAIIEVGPLSVGRQDPFALWSNAKRVGTVERLWVHPVTHRLVGIPAGKTRSIDGRDAEALPQGSITFHALREYVRGDDLRHVHWRSSAKVGTLMVKERVDTALPQLTLILDTAKPSANPEAFEQLVEVAASVAATATGAGFPVRVVTTGGHSIKGRGISADLMEILDFLAGVEQDDAGTLGSTVVALVRERRGDLLVAITGHPDPEALVNVAVLSSRFDRVIVGIVDSASHDIDLPMPANLRILRAEDAMQFARHWNEAVRR